ncbi:MAG: pyridoxamine 5'-phosphate oxidase family protein [Pseudomonadota bacterium]
MPQHLLDSSDFITDEAELRDLHPQPMSRATGKVLPALDRHCRQILALSPFYLIATQGPNGADVSPKGDPPGSVGILDDTTLLLPERVGNNRFDGMVNILSNPEVGLLFLVPGMNETLRINGTARILKNDVFLADYAVNGRAPKIGILVTVREAFLHCGKAVMRSGLWDPEARIDRSSLPSYAQMLLDQVNGLTRAENERQTQIMAERGLY